MFFRESRRPERRSVADLLPWAAANSPNTVVTKGGMLSAAYRYAPKDLRSSTAEELLGVTHAINRAIRTLGNGWMLHIDAVRSPVQAYPAEGAFPDPTTRMIDQERRERFLDGRSHFITRYFLSVSWQTPSETRQTWLQRVLLTGLPDDGGSLNWRRVQETFEARLSQLEGSLRHVLAPRRLAAHELLSLFRCQITGRYHSAYLPEVPMYLDEILVGEDLTTGFRPRIGPRHLRVLSIDGFPHESEPAITDFLSNLPIPCRWSTRWIPMDRETALRKIGAVRRGHLKGRHGLLKGLRAEEAKKHHEAQAVEHYADQGAMALYRDAQEAYAEASTGEVTFGFLSTTVLLFDRDGGRLKESVEEVQNACATVGFSARLEESNSVEAWMGSLTGNAHSNVRRPILHTMNLAGLMPMTGSYAGEASCPNPLLPPGSPPLFFAKTEGSTPYRANLHVSDVGHALVVGTTGTGKSVLLGLLAASWLRYPRARVFVFDKSYSALPLCLAAGGHHYDLLGEGEGGPAFSPLRSTDEPGEKIWAVQWLHGLFETVGSPLDSQQVLAITDAIESLATYPADQRTLTTFKTLLQDQDLRDRLQTYTLAGDFGNLLDATEDAVTTSPFHVFEMGALIDAGPRITAPTLGYLFHRIERSLDGRPTLILVDEAWSFLLQGQFAKQIRAWLKELRKKNAAVVLATQGLADLKLDGESQSFFESTPTKIYLPNKEALSPAAGEAYARLGLNATQIRILSEMTPKRHYYWTSPAGRRQIDLDLGPLALAFLGASDKDSLHRIRQLHREHDSLWPSFWLREQGLDDHADHYFEEVNP